MRNINSIIVLILAVVIDGRGQVASGDNENAVTRSRQLLLDSLRASGVPGVSITVSVNGKVVWSEGLGLADLEQRIPVTPQTKFRIGSISKPLTAAALALLYEEGRIHLDTLIQAYVPYFPAKSRPVTLRQLAGHTAGIRHYRGLEMLSRKRYLTVGEGLDLFRDDSLLFEPGTRYSYSSYGWNLISAAVEGASGQDFLSHMRSRIFGPLGMSNTTADYTDSLIADRARWYTEDSLGQTINAPYVDNSYKWAGGGFLSTTEDLVKFGSAMLWGSLLKKETINLLFTSQRLKDGSETRYGMGWAVRRDDKGRRLVSHTGGSIGGTAVLLLYPDHGLVLAMLVNSDLRFIHHALSVAELFLGS